MPVVYDHANVSYWTLEALGSVKTIDFGKRVAEMSADLARLAGQSPALSDHLAEKALEPARRARILERTRELLTTNLGIAQAWVAGQDQLRTITPRAGAFLGRRARLSNPRCSGSFRRLSSYASPFFSGVGCRRTMPAPPASPGRASRLCWASSHVGCGFTRLRASAVVFGGALQRR